MTIADFRLKAADALNSFNVDLSIKELKAAQFEKKNKAFNLPNLTISEFLNCKSEDIFGLIESKYKLLGHDLEPTPAEAEQYFLQCMERFRVVGDRNIYGNKCTVFTPPSGYPFNEKVSDTYYYMYDNTLDGSKALALWITFIEKSAGYAIKGGPLSMFRWIKEVAVPVAYKEWEMEQADEKDVLNPTLTYLSNQSYQSPFFVAYIFG